MYQKLPGLRLAKAKISNTTHGLVPLGTCPQPSTCWNIIWDQNQHIYGAGAGAPQEQNPAQPPSTLAKKLPRNTAAADYWTNQTHNNGAQVASHYYTSFSTLIHTRRGKTAPGTQRYALSRLRFVTCSWGFLVPSKQTTGTVPKAPHHTDPTRGTYSNTHFTYMYACLWGCERTTMSWPLSRACMSRNCGGCAPRRPTQVHHARVCTTGHLSATIDPLGHHTGPK